MWNQHKIRFWIVWRGKMLILVGNIEVDKKKIKLLKTIKNFFFRGDF